jgi:dTDP-4-dehydrorhamnose reductase
MNSIFLVNEKRIALLGSNGFLGSSISSELTKIGTEITRERMRVTTNAVEMENFLDNHKVDEILNCIALADIPRCQSMPEEAKMLNSDFPGALARYSRRKQIRFVHISTPSVFESSHEGIDESVEVSLTNSIYGLTKSMGESYVQMENSAALICRVNFFGRSQFKDSFFDCLIEKLLMGEPYTAYQDVYFNPLYVGDLSRIIHEVAGKRLQGVLHVAGNECVSKYEFSTLIADELCISRDLIVGVLAKEVFHDEKRSTNTCVSTNRIKNLGVEIPDLKTTIKNSLQH